MINLDISRIDEKHWQGGFWNYLPDPQRLGGVDVVVLCAKEIQPSRAQASAYALSGIEIISAPMVDSEDPEKLPAIIETAGQAADRAIEALNAGKRVLVTCAAGRNRSGIVSGLILVGRRGVSGTQAVEVIQARRLDALTNNSFREFLERIPSRAHRRYAR